MSFGKSSEGSDVDPVLFWLVIGLLSFGVVMVYSASIAQADNSVANGGSLIQFLVRHLFALSVGVSIAILATQIPIRYWQTVAPILFLVALAMLVLVLIPDIGH